MVDSEEFLKLLDRDIARLDSESKKHKFIYRRGQSLIIVLTAVTTIFAGAGVFFKKTNEFTQFIVLCLAATTTALTSWLEMRRARELWQHDREMYYALVDIKREIQFYSMYNKKLTPKQVDAYSQRISTILGSSIESWLRINKNPK